MINIELSIEETNLILGALAELPVKVSLNLMQKIETSATKQVQEAQAKSAQAEAQTAPSE